ncbi:fungal-specific transcription factor domain-containing protein [Lasiosphaeria hispida]|uniref:Fungal-specific transcription factor domain-containing protein n=1 Tax=Lasiosphaeria hispida TaxID=260671 RepID=A0AAJ0HBQ6_9PEZI|nr:fungal-specific transcription factor domain-containing protein [Lasiosphaeria hispida]
MSTSHGKRRAPSEGETAQDCDSPTAHARRQSDKQQIRHRASVACASCRERRIRCVVPEGQVHCTQCKRTGAECVIKNDDERRRPISKAYMSSLSCRIALLEGMLKDRGVAPPPAVHPPKTRQEAQARQQEEDQGQDELQSSESNRADSSERQASPCSSTDGDADVKEPKQENSAMPISHAAHMSLIEPLLLQDAEPRKDVNVRRHLSPKGALAFDQSPGRIRFFGPTANIHVYAESSCQYNSREPPEQLRRTDRVIRGLGSSTHDMLMKNFWDYFNTAHLVVDRQLFEAGRAAQDPKFYSSFLHIAILAAGYRFADRNREDIKRLTLGNWESTLHREAKCMLDIELERPGGAPSVQALLILADLECGVGRDTTGWMYSGMANRLAFDIGLHTDCSTDETTEMERRNRRQAMASCVLLDRQLALLLGRPTSIKNQDVSIGLSPKGSPPLPLDAALFSLPDFDAKSAMTADAVIHQKMMELMELSSRIAESQNTMIKMDEKIGNGYLRAISLDRQMQIWYRRLPEHLTWKPANVKSAPMSFFVLHQQFHASMILLHRPWADYSPTPPDGSIATRYPSPASPNQQNDAAAMGYSQGFSGPQSPSKDNKMDLSRSMCTQHAIRIARIFWQHRQRLDGKKLCLMGVQHAGAAALALMAALAHRSKELDHQSNLRYLQVLSSAIYDMSQTYHPAARMYHLLKSMLVDIRKEMVVNSRNFDTSAILTQFHQNNSNNTGFFVANHWGANPAPNPMYTAISILHEHNDYNAAKRRRLSERRPSEAERPNLPLFGLGYTYPSPPKSSQSHKAFDASKLEVPSPAISSLADDPCLFDFDFLCSAAINFIDHHTGVADLTKNEGALASPAPDAPGERNDGEIVVGLSQKPQNEGEPSAEMTIEEWLAEPRAMTPTSVQQQPSPKPSAAVLDAVMVANTEFNSTPSALVDFGAGGESDGCDGMEWMADVGEEDGMDMSLNDLVQSVQKVVGSETKKTAAARNLELDFLRL